MPSTWIPPSEITRIQGDVAQVLPETAVISRLAEASDGQGGMTQSWSAVGTVDARLAVKSGSTRALGGAQNTVGAYTLTVPVGTDIEEQDRVVIGETAYRVLFVDSGRAWQVALRCDCDLEVT